MRSTSTVGTLALSLFLLSLRGQTTTPGQAPNLKPNQGVKITFEGYVRDLACLVKFDGALKPINDCAEMRARAGRLWLPAYADMSPMFWQGEKPARRSTSA